MRKCFLLTSPFTNSPSLFNQNNPQSAFSMPPDIQTKKGRAENFSPELLVKERSEVKLAYSLSLRRNTPASPRSPEPRSVRDPGSGVTPPRLPVVPAKFQLIDSLPSLEAMTKS